MINLQETINYWLNCAKEDYKVMEHLYEKKDYHYALFLGHLLLEKTLKAYFIKQNNTHAPYSHSLVYLAEKSKLKLNNEFLTLLEAVEQFNIEARYPDKKFEFYKLCTKEFTAEHINKIKEFYQWLLPQI